MKNFHFGMIGDERGSLISLESNKNIPFTIKRVYYIFDTKENITRGRHAHKKLEQIIVCVNGSCDILLDSVSKKETVRLDKRNEGLYVGTMIWREIYNFSPDCVLMVLASDYYDESDYIRNYDEFLEYDKK